MAEQQIAPAFDTPQQLRAAVELEMQMCGLRDVQRTAVMKQVDAYVIEAIVSSSAELLTSERTDVRWSLWDIENRLLGTAPIGGEEMLARVAAATATRTNVVAGYERIRRKLIENLPALAVVTEAPSQSGQAAASIPSVQTPHLQPLIVSIAVAGWNLVKPTLTLPARLILYLFGIFTTLVIVIWFLNASGIAGLLHGVAR